MAVYRVDVGIDDPEKVFSWLRERGLFPRIIRCVGYSVHDGWVIKTVFKEKRDADEFHRHWFPDELVHDILAWPN